MAANIDFIKNAFETLANSLKDLGDKTENIKKQNALWHPAGRHKCIEECLPLIREAYNEKMSTIDALIKAISVSLGDPTINGYAQKLKKALEKASESLDEIISYGKTEQKQVASNFKTQIKQRIDNLNC